MRTTLALAGLALVTAGLPLASTSHSASAPAECQGLTATITSDGGTVLGTTGSDVISTTGVVDIQALGGNDVICLSEGSVDGGDGFDSLRVVGPRTDASAWTVDLTSGVRRAGASVVTFAGLEAYSLDYGRPVEVSVEGTDGPDYLEVVSGTYDADLGAGDDTLAVGGYGFGGRFDAGDGTDALWALDVVRIAIRLGQRGGVVMGGETFDIAGVEDVAVDASRIAVRGSSAANRMDLTGCIVDAHGKGGDDVLKLAGIGDLTCQTRNLKLYGGGGDDRLLGSSLRDKLLGGNGGDVLKGRRGDDTLVGGSGHDKAFGSGGRDVCDAEITASCEARA